MTPTARFDRLDTFIRENRIIRGSWGDGKERACLLLALAPEVGSGGNISACPASVLPPWLAELTPSIDDRVAVADWADIVATYARVVRRGSERLDAAGWRRVLARFLASVLGDLPGEHPANVAAMWRRVLAGDEPTEQEWRAAAEAAEAAADAAEAAETETAAEAAAAAAWAAAEAVARAKAVATWAAWAAEYAARAATWAAEEAEEAEAWAARAAAAAARAEWAATWSRIARHLFSAIEAEVAA